MHPIVDVHPVSGRRYLYLSTPTRCAHISGMSPQQAAEMVEFLFAHSTRADNVYRHTVVARRRSDVGQPLCPALCRSCRCRR